MGGRLGTGLRRAAAAAWAERPTFARTPFTVFYIGLLAVTTLLLGALDGPLHHRVLAESSTDVAHLRSAPVRVLVASALWLPEGRWWFYAAGLALVLAPVERRIGPWWTFVVFASGHVAATLLTELPVEAAIDAGRLPAAAAHRLDVGVSYGFLAVFAVLLGMCARRPRWWVAAPVLAEVLRPALVHPGVTSVGHALSLGIGAAWWPWLRRRDLLGGSAPTPAPRRRP